MPIYRTPTEPLRRPKLPRLGIIRLGYKETRKRPDGSEYTFPRAADHFVLDDAQAVAQVYGDEPTVLEPVYFPLENEDLVANHYLRMYGQTWGLLCKGDGRTAQRQVDPDRLKATGEPVPAGKDTKRPVMATVNCPCLYLESGDCREALFLQVMLPDVPGLGVWQLATGSANSIQNILGFLAALKVSAGRITNIPLKLNLVPQRTISYQRGGSVTVYVLKLDLAQQLTIMQLNAGVRDHTIGILPAPDENPPDDYPASEDGIEAEIPPVAQWTPRATWPKPRPHPPLSPNQNPQPRRRPHVAPSLSPGPAGARRPRRRPAAPSRTVREDRTGPSPTGPSARTIGKTTVRPPGGPTSWARPTRESQSGWRRGDAFERVGS